MHSRDLAQGALVNGESAVTSMELDRIVVEIHGAGEQEAAVATRRTPGDLAGIDGHHALSKLEQPMRGGQARTTEAHDAHVGRNVAPQRVEAAPRGVVPYRSVGAQLIPTRPLTEAKSKAGS